MCGDITGFYRYDASSNVSSRKGNIIRRMGVLAVTEMDDAARSTKNMGHGGEGGHHYHESQLLCAHHFSGHGRR